MTFIVVYSQDSGFLFYTCFNTIKNCSAHQEDGTAESLILLQRQGNGNTELTVLIHMKNNGELGKKKLEQHKTQTKNPMSVLLHKLLKKGEWQDNS